MGGVEAGGVVEEVGGFEGVAGLAGEKAEEFDEMGALAFVGEVKEFLFEFGGVGFIRISGDEAVVESVIAGVAFGAEAGAGWFFEGAIEGVAEDDLHPR